jgi:hypothetical protein
MSTFDLSTLHLISRNLLNFDLLEYSRPFCYQLRKPARILTGFSLEIPSYLGGGCRWSPFSKHTKAMTRFFLGGGQEGRAGDNSQTSDHRDLRQWIPQAGLSPCIHQPRPRQVCGPIASLILTGPRRADAGPAFRRRARRRLRGDPCDAQGTRHRSTARGTFQGRHHGVRNGQEVDS